MIRIESWNQRLLRSLSPSVEVSQVARIFSLGNTGFLEALSKITFPILLPLK